MEFENVRDSITELFLNLSQQPAILVGDFNYKKLRELLPGVFKIGYRQVFEEDTSPKKGQQDYILYSKHWQSKGYEIIKTETDHYLCVGEFQQMQ